MKYIIVFVKYSLTTIKYTEKSNMIFNIAITLLDDLLKTKYAEKNLSKITPITVI